MQIDKSNFSEWYNTITKDAELCDLRYGIKGFVVFMPWSVMTMNRMYSMMEQALEKKGHVPALFPALIPESYLTKESKHVEGFVPEVMWVTQAGSTDLEERCAMRPTSETAMYTMYSMWIHGLKDLPLKIYQRCQVWRYETKATKPFIRSREFYWIEAHDCFATEKDAMKQVREDMETSEEVLHQQYGIPFLFFKRPQWDKFPGAVNTFAADTLMPDGKALQLPSTHMLGQNFSKAFDVKYKDEKGNDEYVWQTCYGPAISRIYAALIAMHGDSNGLIIPFDLAPVQVVIVPIYRDDTKKAVLKECKKLQKKLSKDFTVKLDDSDNTPGFKFNQWEMKGVPIRLELGPRDLEKGQVVLVRRDTKEKSFVSLKSSELKKMILKTRDSILETLKSRADQWFSDKLSFADTMGELERKTESRGFIRVPFCTEELDGKPCAEVLKDKFQMNMRGSLFGTDTHPKDKKCIACGKDATVYLYAAHQY
ncbi:proline--tRNA ligase [Candidatus Micrarchaeota archaeon]|nr:proline--tRNA ligase [Candidatus Micrarchaeota archaeon]MBU1166527.1 proline--tRNA ligase [Candidatus Micrarchaeota archaeon]MBU1887539.1 proline--tRNA ligase [Candidatus Micrarchaeota archaeon]